MSDLKARALALYKAPFKFLHGYIQDADSRTVADDDGNEAEPLRVRGWGRISYLPDAEALQDQVGAIIAEALTEYWARASQAPAPSPANPYYVAFNPSAECSPLLTQCPRCNNPSNACDRGAPSPAASIEMKGLMPHLHSYMEAIVTGDENAGAGALLRLVSHINAWRDIQFARQSASADIAPGKLEQVRLRFFRDLATADRKHIFHIFGVEDKVLAEVRTYTDEVRVFEHLFKRAAQ